MSGSNQIWETAAKRRMREEGRSHCQQVFASFSIIVWMWQPLLKTEPTPFLLLPASPPHRHEKHSSSQHALFVLSEILDKFWKRLVEESVNIYDAYGWHSTVSRRTTIPVKLDAQSQFMDYVQHAWKIHLACGPLLAIPFPTGFKRQRQIAGGPFFWLQPISHLLRISQAPLQHVSPLKSHVQGPWH